MYFPVSALLYQTDEVVVAQPTNNQTAGAPYLPVYTSGRRKSMLRPTTTLRSLLNDLAMAGIRVTNMHVHTDRIVSKLQGKIIINKLFRLP